MDAEYNRIPPPDRPRSQHTPLANFFSSLPSFFDSAREFLRQKRALEIMTRAGYKGGAVGNDRGPERETSCGYRSYARTG